MLVEQQETIVAALQKGEVVAFPTDTVYGLGCDANNEAALARIYALKQRPLEKPLILFLAQQAQVFDYAAVVPETAQKLMAAFWPGPLTIVLPKKASVSDAITAGLDTIGLRMPNQAEVLTLLQESGLTLATTSANRSGEPSLAKASEVEAVFQQELLILAGEAKGQIASTVVAVNVDGTYQILRAGMITAADITSCLGEY